MSKFNISRKYRIYPNDEQISIIENTFGCCRFVWNKLLERASMSYFDPEETFNIVNYGDIVAEYEFLQDESLKIDRHAISNEKMFLKKAFKCFFDNSKKNKVFRKDGNPKGFPRYKSKKNPKCSYTNMSIKNYKRELLDYDTHLINLPIIGLTKFDKREKQVPEHWKECNVTISRSHDKYYVSICFEYEDDTDGINCNIDQFKICNPDHNISILGLDYASKCLYLDSNGQSASYPRYYRRSQKRLRMLNKQLSRRQKGGRNYKKTKLKVSKLHEHIANQRKDFLHKLSTSITKMYDVICVENIDMKAISMGLKLGKSTMDNGFGMFREMLLYKQKRISYHLLVFADRYYPSSKLCSKCYHKNDNLALSDRIYKCPKCGNVIQRDHNAALNLRNEALRMLNESIIPESCFKLLTETTLGVSLLSDGVTHLG